MDDAEVIEKVLNALTEAGHVLEDENIELSDAWLRVAAQWLYVYEHVGLPGAGEEEEEEAAGDEEYYLEDALLPGTDFEQYTTGALNGHSRGDVVEATDGEVELVGDDDDPDDIRRLGP